MTIAEVSKQLYDLSVSGKFNGEVFSQSELTNYISNMFRVGSHLALGNRLVMNISLPDGDWYFSVDRYSDDVDGFGYYIPETREQESVLFSKLLNAYNREVC